MERRFRRIDAIDPNGAVASGKLWIVRAQRFAVRAEEGSDAEPRTRISAYDHGDESTADAAVRVEEQEGKTSWYRDHSTLRE